MLTNMAPITIVASIQNFSPKSSRCRPPAPGRSLTKCPSPSAMVAYAFTAVNTFLLICSSVTMVKAYATIADGEGHFVRLRPGAGRRQRLDLGLKFWMLATIVIGAMFVSIQVFEYLHLVHRGFLPSGVREGSELAELVANGALPAATMGLYGSTFYTMTGFHGFHVTCGVISMTYLYVTKALRGKCSRHDYRGVEVIGLYWHFVDLLWIILFTIVCLI